MKISLFTYCTKKSRGNSTHKEKKKNYIAKSKVLLSFEGEESEHDIEAAKPASDFISSFLMSSA